MSVGGAQRDDPELQALSEALHALYDPVLEEPVPVAMLRARRPRWRAMAIAAGWVAVGIATGTVLGWHAARGPAGLATADVPRFVQRAAVAHATYSPEVRHPVEVGADQEAHLVAWLSKRLGAPLRAPKLEEIGYSLVGGRLLPGDAAMSGAAAPVAHLMYQGKSGARVTVYMRTEGAANRDTAFRFSAEGNVKVFYWIDRRLGYAVSSADISKDELLKVATAIYQQLNP